MLSSTFDVYYRDDLEHILYEELLVHQCIADVVRPLFPAVVGERRNSKHVGHS